MSSKKGAYQIRLWSSKILLLILTVISLQELRASESAYEYNELADHQNITNLEFDDGDDFQYRRVLRRGGSRKSRSSYYSGKYSSQYKTKYTANNNYFKSGKTYQPLYTYFRPLGFYHAIGYYSIVHQRIYYNGYGYNFYYGLYGYYETSENDKRSEIPAILIMCCMLCCCIGFCVNAIKNICSRRSEK